MIDLQNNVCLFNSGALAVMEFKIDCQTRPSVKNKALRRQGLVPGVLYGVNGSESLSLVLDEHTAARMLQKTQINNSLITVDVKELELSVPSLLREVQKNPANNHEIYHLSFWAVGEQSLHVTVPLKIVGKAAGIADGTGVLEIALSSLEASCLSNSIPEDIIIDISHMHTNDVLTIRDIVLPTGVVAIGALDRKVVSIINH